MSDSNRLPEGFLDPVAGVVETMREQVPDFDPTQVMLVGAWCRDTLHAALGHDFGTKATRDIDLALALRSWDVFEQLASAFPRAGASGVAFKIARLVVDLLPFGDLENPAGSIVPPTRKDAINVWAFAEIFEDSFALSLDTLTEIRCACVPGYVAAKLAAWLDRSEWGEVKDANDIALALFWYAESKDVEQRLYDTSEGQDVLVVEEADVPCAAARLLGQDVAAVVGPERLAELIARWQGSVDMLTANLVLPIGPGRLAPLRRREVVDALTRGLVDPRLG